MSPLLSRLFGIARNAAAVGFAAVVLVALLVGGAYWADSGVKGKIDAALAAASGAGPASAKTSEQARVPEEPIDAIARARLGMNADLAEMRLLREAQVERRDLFEKRLKEEIAAVEAQRASYRNERSAWERMVGEEKATLNSEGFKKNLEVFNKMQPEEVAALLWNWPDEKIVVYLKALKDRKSSEVISALLKLSEASREEADRKRASTILDLLEKGRKESPAAPMGKP